MANNISLPVIEGLPVDEPVTIERMKQYPFFAEVPDKLLGTLRSNVFERTYVPGDIILRMGEYGDAAYYVAEGRVEVRLGGGGSDGLEAPAKPGFWSRFRRAYERGEEPPRPSTGLTAEGTVVLADMPVEGVPGESVYLGPGELFGEMSALSRFPISADVVAAEPTRALLITTSALRIMFRRPQFKDFKEAIDGRYRERTLATHLSRVELFADLGDEVIERLRDCAELLSYDPGNVIVEEGADSDGFYLVRGGFVKIGIASGSGELAVTYLRKGDYAGEVSLLLDEPWPFGLTALEHVEMVRITQQDFEHVLAQSPRVESRLWDSVVQKLKERGFAARNPISAQHVQMAMDTGLIHGESVLLIDGTVCTRCDDCVRGCAATHGGVPRFIREGIKYRNWSVPTACYQCTDPVCMIGCPTGAITRPIGTPEVLIDPVTCIGCGNCERRCPWDNIVSIQYHNPTLGRDLNLATKCDQCFGRDEGPACVQMCPHGAAIRISFKDLENVATTLKS